MNILSVEIAGRRFRANAAQACDISIPLKFDGSTVQAFGAPAASSQVHATGSFVGDVARGGSCNCRSYHLTPHCHGTHTESVGHLTADAVPVNELAQHGLMLARLVTITPTDQLITLTALQTALDTRPLERLGAVVVRTLPNDESKYHRNYDTGESPAWFDAAALAWLARNGIQHLLTDLPSVDRMDDGGHLLAHRAFWGLPPGDTQAAHATRPGATITELIYVANALRDGDYLLSLQLAPLVADATPSRPLLYPLLSE